MKSLFIISLALFVTNSHVSAIVANCAEEIPPSGSYTNTCTQIDFLEIVNSVGENVCLLSAWCKDFKGVSKFTKKSGTVGTFPDECSDIKNRDGHLECVK